MRSARVLAWSLGISMAVAACGDDDAGTTRDGSVARDTGSTPRPQPPPASCGDDSLRTGLTAVQTGVSVDAFDCEILHWVEVDGEPDPMIVKAMIYVESRFDHTSAGCSNRPCGTPDGWADDETGCFGLMQVVPACRGPANAPCLLPNGRPNMTRDESSAEWATSVFNPDINIQIGVAGFAGNRREVEEQFAGCTDDQYTLLALGNLANHGSSQGCDVYNREYVSIVLDAYDEYAAAAGYAAHPYPR